MNKEEVTKITTDQITKWLGENQTWLTAWLTNVVIVQHIHIDHTFKTITVPVYGQPPESLIEAMKHLQKDLIISALFGRPSSIISIDGASVNQLLGFNTKYKRFPTEKDGVLFTAAEWNSVYIEHGQFFLRTITTVEFFPRT